MLSYLVAILASGEESGLVAAALWALLQLAADDPANQKVSALMPQEASFTLQALTMGVMGCCCSWPPTTPPTQR